MSGRLESINSSRGGVPKASMFEGLVTERGVDGDRQRDRRCHGGPDRAVLYSLDVIRALLISASFLGHDFTRISQKLHSGCSRVCARVLAGGLIRIGDPVTIA